MEGSFRLMLWDVGVAVMRRELALQIWQQRIKFWICLARDTSGEPKGLKHLLLIFGKVVVRCHRTLKTGKWMPKTSLTVDCDTNQKLLRLLERQGFVEIHALNIESAINNKKLKRKDMPLAVINSPHSSIEGSIIAADDTIWPDILAAMTKDNHGDAMQLEGHIRSGRDIFVTDDKDILERRNVLKQRFGVTVKSTQEIVEMFDGSSD
ncbi:hypothetical protein MHM39_01120 [Phaeobacter sp. CNT1-3]|nr:hypothetical protein [Phaeobacter sp. CNT1-3]